MKSFKRVMYTNRGLIFLNLLILAIMGGVGFFLHDIIVALDKTDEEMTVFPLGTLCMFLAIIFFTCFFSHQSGMYIFNMNISMGQTRKCFFVEQLILRIVLVLADMLILFGMYQLELLKFEKFYYSRYTLETELSEMFTFKFIFMMVLAAVSFCMMVLALSLKFGMKANVVTMIVYFAFIILMTRVETIASYVEMKHFDFGLYADTLYYVFTVLFAIGIVVSGLLIRKQQVTV